MDKKHYREVKKFMLHNLNHVPWCVKPSSPFDWAKTFFPLITYCVKRNDFEGAKATKDAIIEFLNQFLGEADKIPKDALLKIPTEVNLWT